MAQAYTDERAKKLLDDLRRYMEAKDCTQTLMAKKLMIAASSISALFHSVYSGDQDVQLKKIEQFLDREAEAAEAPKLTKFAETTIASKILRCCRQNHIHGTIGLVLGDAGKGKTRALREYAGRTPGVLVISASRWTRTSTQLANKLADKVLQRNIFSNTQDRCEALIEEMRGQSRLIIIDQAHQLREDAHEFIQNLWDECQDDAEGGIGIVLSATMRFHREIVAEKNKYLYEQLLSRIDNGFTVQLKERFVIGDIEKIFCRENLEYPLSGPALKYLLAAANGAQGLRTAVASVVHLQEFYKKKQFKPDTELSVDGLQMMGQVMLREAA